MRASKATPVLDEQVAALEQFTEIGSAYGCPFCEARMISEVSPGDRLNLTKGPCAGCRATVSGTPDAMGDEFLVHVDGDPDTTLFRVSYLGDNFVREPLQPLPSWMCPLAITDLLILEERALRGLLRSFESGAKTIRVEAAQALAAVAWWHRLPVTGGQVWAMLEAHGFDKRWQSDFCKLFDFGFSLLVSTHGRKPIRKKIIRSNLV
jgi:hypothetical protein